MPVAIVDTGPLVAFLDRSERYHRWVGERVDELAAPLLVCEPVMTEAMYLLSRYASARDTLYALLQNGALCLAFRMEQHIPELQKLQRKYRDTPMSLADACIVRMAELYERHSVLTLDSDFTVYRKNGDAPLLVIAPE